MNQTHKDMIERSQTDPVTVCLVVALEKVSKLKYSGFKFCRLCLDLSSATLTNVVIRWF